MTDDTEFVIEIKPRLLQADGRGGGTRDVYDIYVSDSENGELLVFSNQGYENRGDAEKIAVKLFATRPASLVVYDAGGQAIRTTNLSILPVIDR